MYAKREGTHGVVRALSPSVMVSKFRLKDHNAVMHVTEMLRNAIGDNALILDGSLWVVRNWNIYQEPDSTAKDRQQAYRDRQKELKELAKKSTITPLRNGDNAVTLSRDHRPPTTNSSSNEEVLEETGVSSLSEQASDEVMPVVEIEEPKAKVKKKRSKKPPEEWECHWIDFCLNYPTREGDLNKTKGKVSFGARINKGVKPEIMIEGAARYKAFCDAKRMTGTTMVKQIPSFLNQDSYLEDWKVLTHHQPSFNGVHKKTKEELWAIAQEKFAKQ